MSQRGGRPSRSLAQEVEGGGEITNYNKHESGDNFTVHVKGKDGGEHVYTNVTPEHLKEYLGEEPEEGGGSGSGGGNGGKGRRASSSGGGGGKKGETQFDQLMKGGAKVSDIKETKRGTYTVHVTDQAGKTHNFSSVGGEHLEQYGVKLPS